jgi:hypothetical protein
MMTKTHSLNLIGRREFVDFPMLNIEQLVAKIDTGAYTCAIHCKQIDLKIIEKKETLCVKFLDDKIHYFTDFFKKKIKNSFSEMEERFVIKTIIQLGHKKIKTSISLTDRASMKYPVLIGRRLLKGKFIVDVNLIYTNGIII